MRLNLSRRALIVLFGVGPIAMGSVSAETVADDDLNACLVKVMEFAEGPFDYTGVNARINGEYSTFITQSTHTRLPDDTWEYSSFGGDMEERSTSFVRLVGNQILTRSDAEDASEAARTFKMCEGPDEVGRITTKSTYELPPVESGPQTLLVEITALYGETGGYFAETIKNEAGEIIAYRSGVSISTK